MLSRVFQRTIRSQVTTSHIRTLASSNGDNRRRTPRALEKPLALKQRSKKAKAPVILHDDADLTKAVGPDAASALKYIERYGDRQMGHEDFLRAADFMTSDLGTTEDLVGRRRGLMEAWSPQEAKELEERLDELIEEEADNAWQTVPWNENLMSDDKDFKPIRNDEEDVDPNQMAFGPWSDTVVRVDRVQKVQRGGTMVRYRALVIGGNLNGCAGFGVAKANAPNEATAAASRMAKRNIFFIDRYNGSGLTNDLAGRHNSCRVHLRSVNNNKGLNGHPLIMEILKYFGITDCTAKSHGNRNVYNVVRATFKAIMTHESLEDIALKRGKRLMNLERAKKLRI
jgi:small subunit ribosomal protein S5